MYENISKTKMSNFRKCVCFSFNLTLAARAIAFLGLGLSTFLVTVLLNDHSDYYYTRKTAFALGLDWSHIHKNASITDEADPEGTMISIIAISYAVIFLLTNFFLLLGSILNKRYLALPWLVCELVGCLSKIGALITHLVNETNTNINVIFVGGSTIYIVVIIWLWIVIFLAHLNWSKPPTDFRGKTFEDVLPLNDIPYNTTYVQNSQYVDFYVPLHNPIMAYTEI